MSKNTIMSFLLALLITITASACNLTSAPEEAIVNTGIPTNTITPMATIGGVATSISITQPVFPTSSIPTSIGFFPTIPVLTATPSATSIFIVSPVPGNVVTGNVQVVGSALHPNFLQYQLEFGPEPNPANLWYLIGGVQLAQVNNGSLGLWTTTDGRSPDGMYQVRLRVFLRDGNVLQTVVNNLKVQNAAPTIQPSPTQSIPRPIAAFIATPTIGKQPLVVSFTNVSSGIINTYAWNFGDGSTSADRNPVHTYRNPGEFEVRLTVTGPGGQSNVSTIITVQTADPPVADFTADITSGTTPLNVQFTNKSSGQIDSYQWDFGDGVETNEINPKHRFNEARTYYVVLKVKGPGGTSKQRLTIVVQNPQVQPPVADFIPKNTTGDTPLTVQFSDRSTGQNLVYEWDFGDGTTSIDKNPIKIYQTPGQYTVKLTVTNPGGRSEVTGTVAVNQPIQVPDANFTALPTEGNAPLMVQFTDASTGTVTRYEWSFGDNSPVDTNRNPSHVFQQTGTYTVRLTAFAANNASDFKEMTISVTRPIQPPDAAFTVDKTEVSIGLPVTFTNQSSGDNLSFLWNFGDNTTSNSTDAVLTHAYPANGQYTVTLTASNISTGASDTASQIITVTDALTASFTTFQMGDPVLSAQFNSTSTGTITNYRWDFGDSIIVEGLLASTTHGYTAAGVYNVTLTISGTGGTTNSITQQITIVAPTPTSTIPAPTETPLSPTSTSTDLPTATETPQPLPSATFTETATATLTETPTQTSQPLPDFPTANFSSSSADNITFNFVDASTPAGTITAWSWNFGGLGASFEQNSVFTFPSNGNYDVQLLVTNAAGTSTVFTQTISVTGYVEAPIANFSFSSADNITFNFVDTSTPVGSITGWSWNFGELGTSLEQNSVFTFPSNGNYDVQLLVTNAAGTSTVFTQTISVTGYVEAPIANFSFSSADNITFNFVDTSTPVGNITAWSWNFGELGTSLEQNPVFTFPSNGNYDVQLLVTNAAGTSTVFTQTISVTGYVEAPIANFSFSSADNITFNFVDTSTPVGSITGWSWNFGELGTSFEQNPVFTFPSNGNYDVQLLVTNATGTSTVFTQTISVTGYVEALVADFTFSSADNITFNFVDASTPPGTITSWAWNFDRLGESFEQNPVFTFTTNGEYTVRLTVTNQSGQAEVSKVVSVTGNVEIEPTQVQDNLADTTPAQPDIAAIASNLSAYVNPRRDPSVFALAGDNSTKQDSFLKPFGEEPPYQLDGNTEFLRSTIDAYIANGSFTAGHIASGNDLHAANLRNDSPAECNGEALFPCELTQNTGSIVIISIGLRDALDGTDQASFRDDFSWIIQSALDRRVIPVVMTIYPRPGGEDVIKQFNEIIIEVANEKGVPVVNIWRLMNDITASSGQAMDGNNPAVGGGSADILTGDTIFTFGENARNSLVLTVLSDIRSQILGQ